MESPAAYIPMDRRQAMVEGRDLPDRTSGAALFADISGFMPLTAAMAEEFGAKQGAEELAIQLNTVYGALIAEVHSYRGSVIGFSGDAITCWFDDDDGLRATACALAMQQVMSRFAEVEVRSGVSVSLAIKVAVAAGSARRFLVGDPQIQTIDVLAGATLDRMAEAEKQAQKGEVVVGPQAASQLGGKVKVLEWRDDVETERAGRHGRFAIVAGLRRRVEADPWPTLPPSAGKQVGQVANGCRLSALSYEEQMRPWFLPPVYERLRTGQGRFLAELRPAVALFLKFGGLNYDEDDAAGEKLDVYIRWVQNVLARYEGSLLQLTTGDKGSYLYAAFGAPLAHDDDPARAVAAAVELRSPLPEADRRHPVDFITGVQIGVSQGRMRAGAYGGPTRRTYGVLGDEVNVAARLMGKAGPGRILVSERVANAAAKSYHFESLGTVELKGKKEPLPVYAPLDRRLPSSQRPAALFTHPLVGRDDELAQMERVLESVLAGEGRILRLGGVAGIGKSHLAAEFAEQAFRRGLRVVLGACQSISQDIPYYPWQQIFQALFELTGESLEGKDSSVSTARQIAQVEAIINETNPAWLLRLPLLGDLLGLPIPDNETTAAFDPRLRQEALLALAVEIVQAQAQAQPFGKTSARLRRERSAERSVEPLRAAPLLLLIEDAHWMDEASLKLTLALGRAVARAPVLLALVYRPPIRDDQPLLPDLNRLPFCCLMNLSELSPQGVAALVAQRLQREQPSALTLDLIQAQAHGNPFFTEELVDTLRESEELCRQEDGMWALSEAIFNGLRDANCLARKDGGWGLAQDAQLSAADLGIPDTIHGIVLSRLDRLPEMHKLTTKVASVVGRIFEFDLLAQAHPVHPGREALLDQMGVLKARDLARLETPPPRLTYIFKHNITQEVAYDTLLEEQQRELHQAVGEALEGLQPEAVERLAYHYRRSDVRDKAMFYLDKAARKAQAEYANETALSYYNQALALEEHWEWRKGQVEVLHVLGQREDEKAGLELLEAAPEAPVFDVAYLWGQYHEAVSEYPQAQSYVERAVGVCRDLSNVVGEVHCLAQIGAIAARQGDFDEARNWYNQALALLQDEETHSDEEAQSLARTLNGLGIAYAQQGRLDEAKACWERALKLSRRSGNRIDEAQALNNLGLIDYSQRNFAEALAYHRQALEIRRAIGDRTGEGSSLYNLAIAFLEAGDYGQAQDCLSRALPIHQATGNLWDEAKVWNDQGILYLLLGDLPKAQTCLEQGLKLSQEIGDEAGRADVLCNLGLYNMGLVARGGEDLEAAEKLLTDSLALAQSWGDKGLVSMCLSYLGIVSLRAGRLDQAVDRANAALTMRKDLTYREEMDLLLLTTIDLTTLAAAYSTSGDTDAALDYARQAMTVLDKCGGEGPEFPQRDYFLCYQVLSAAGQGEAARTALQSAYDLVMAKAEKITDSALRQSFLERVQFNREIVQEHENVMRET